MTISIKDVSKDVTRTMTETSEENNNAVENFNNILLAIMNDRGIIASYLLSHLSKITNREHLSQLKLVKDPSSNRVNYLLINKTVPVTANENLLTLRDTYKKFELEGDLLKMTTNKNYIVDLANLVDKKLIFDFAREM